MMHIIEPLASIASDDVENILVDNSTMECARNRRIGSCCLENLPMTRCKLILYEIIVASLVGVDSTEQIHLIIQHDSSMTISAGW